jgi:two-component system, OmpR family, alkaline phosphatase synthesis response regulator PhoP
MIAKKVDELIYCVAFRRDKSEFYMVNPLILLADDEPHITHIISHKLKRAGMDVIVVEDGEMALNETIANKPDAIVTDLQMPYLSGIELAQQLSQTPECKDIPIILLTARGYAVEDEIENIPSIKKMLSKPFSAKDLLGYINELLEGGDNSIGRCA